MSRHFFKRPLLRVFMFGLLLALIDGPIRAQEATSLKGAVTDPAGQAVAGATITLTDPASGVSRIAVTKADGLYQFSQLRPGAYALRIEMTGFKATVYDRVQLLVATPATLNLQLEVGQVTEQVNVEAGVTPTLNTFDATVGHPIVEREVKSLPFLARNPVNLLTLQPGVVFTGESDTDLLFQGSIARLDKREGAVNGVRGNQTNITVDGANASDWQNQAAFTSALPVTLDSLQEFRTVTATANATDGGASGAQVAMVTKSGSNDWRGNLRWYHRNTTTAANSFFNNRVKLARPKLLRNIGGGSLGGRLWRDRAFFFVDFEARRDASEETVLRSVPVETYKQGILTYLTASGARVTLAGDQFRAIDPQNRGVNPAVTQYYSLFPQGNDPSGGDGLNSTGLRFNAPIRNSSNISTARFDFNLTADGRHTAFWRGTLGDIKRDLLPPQFPGRAPNSALLNNSKGFAAGYTARLGSQVVNSFQFGLTRPGVEQTGSSAMGWSIFFPTVTSLVGTDRGLGRRIPQWEIKDDLTWTRGGHTLQTGGVTRFIRNSLFNDLRSFPGVLTAGSASCCRAPYDALLRDGDPANDPANLATFAGAYTALTGAITSTFAFALVDHKAGQLLPFGTSFRNEFREDHYEAYAQDSWRLRANLTLTLGVRYSYFTPLGETSGKQLRPTVDAQDWFEGRVNAMQSGAPADALPRIGFELSGKVNNARPWWDPDRNNFAPRMAIAWSPNFAGALGRAIFGKPGRSAVRAGFGLYYDRVGGPIATNSNLDGNQGLVTRLGALPGVTLANAARFSGSCDTSAGCSGFPPFEQISVVPKGIQFPFTPPDGALDPSFMIDNRLSTPYNRQYTLSIQRELPGRITLDLGYVGTQGRRLLLNADFNQYLGRLTDPASGQTLWQAMSQLVGLMGANPLAPAINPNDAAALAAIRPIPFVENMLSNLPAFLAPRNPIFAGLTPTQAFYSYLASRAPDYGTALGTGFDISPGATSPWSRSIDPQQNGFVLFSPQMSFGLTTVTNWGRSDYHSFQLSLRRNIGGSLFGFNYVFSKSIDNYSAFENSILDGSGGTVVSNAFNPDADRAVSNFDVRHNFNAHWTLDLPIGKGRRLAANANGLLDRLIGGWEVVGAWRWRSGLALTPAGLNRTFNLFTRVPPTITTEVETGVRGDGAGGSPNLFANPEAERAKISFTLPGESGSRNTLRSPGYFTVDLGAHKSFRLSWGDGRHRLELRWDAFNVFNNVNFSTTSIDLTATSTTFGRISATAGPRGGSREMEFAIRYTF